MKIKISLLIVCIGLMVSACTQKEKTCVIIGKVNNRPQSSELRLTKHFVDFRSKSTVRIPIEDGAFKHQFNFKDIEAYTLVFEDEMMQGSMRPIVFFTSNDTIKMELFPMDEHQKNVITGSEINKKFIEYQKKIMDEVMIELDPIFDSISVLQETDNYHSQLMKDLFEKLENTEKQEDKFKMYTQINKMYESGEGLTLTAKKLNTKSDSVGKVFHEKELEYLKRNISIPSYFILTKNILKVESFPEIYNLDALTQLQKKYAAKYKSHPYTQYSSEVLWRLSNKKPGGDYFDFTLPDLEGKEHSLSNEIKGKYALINIWAPWCGPCIAKSREIKPIFEDFKNRGFTVIGVASKYETLESVENLLEKDNYPWITLIDKPEIDSRINEHYGIEMAGGGSVLVDNNGKVILIDPTADEVKLVLETNL